MKINLTKPKAFYKKYRSEIETVAIYAIGVVAGGAVAYSVMIPKIRELQGEQIHRLDLFSSEDVSNVDFTLLLHKVNGTNEAHLIQELPFN